MFEPITVAHSGDFCLIYVGAANIRIKSDTTTKELHKKLRDFCGVNKALIFNTFFLRKVLENSWNLEIFQWLKIQGVNFQGIKGVKGEIFSLFVHTAHPPALRSEGGQPLLELAEYAGRLLESPLKQHHQQRCIGVGGNGSEEGRAMAMSGAKTVPPADICGRNNESQGGCLGSVKMNGLSDMADGLTRWPCQSMPARAQMA